MMIPEHPTWQIVDSSKLDEFERCRRRFFYRYILGWVPDRPNHDLYFGQAWHIAREYMLIHGYDKILQAYDAFEEFYRKEFPADTDVIYRPKDPMGVLTALSKYEDEPETRRDLIDNKILLTETAGTVPINNRGRVLYYRMDSVVQRNEDGKIFSWDHKSRRGTFNRQWSEKFFLSIQNGTYTHCMYCMYPIDMVLGLVFDGCGFEYLKRPSKNRDAGYHVTFKRVPAFKPPDQMNSWLWTVNWLYDEYERELDALSSCTPDDVSLFSFPMNDTACMDFFGCHYHDFCIAWQNPLQRFQEPPPGYKQEFWNPAEIESTHHKDLEWK